MADNQLEIVLSAETKAATAAIQQFAKNVGVSIKEGISVYDAFEAKIKEVQVSLKAASDPAAVARLTAELRNLEKGFKSIKAGDFEGAIGRVGKSTQAAIPTLTNFGRVLQDAPFGIVGIANNIDPLISSFQSLSKQTGSTTGALRSLFAGLAGPAGIAIGISAVTSAFIAFGPEISRAISGLSAFDIAAREAATKGAEAFAKANDEFGNLVRIANDGTNSVARQTAAFETANKQLAAYGLEITNLATFQQEGARIGSLYAQIKQEEAKATVLAAKAAEAYAKQVEIGITAQQGDALGLLGNFSFGDQVSALFGNIANPAGTATAVIEGYTNAVDKAKQEENLFNAETLKVRQNIDGLIKELGSVNGVKENFGKKVKSNTASLEDQRKTLVAFLNDFKGVSTTVNQVDRQGNSFLQLADAIDKARQAQEGKNIADKAAALLGQSRAAGNAPANVAQGRGPAAGIVQQQTQLDAEAAKKAQELQVAAQNTQAAFNLISPAIDQAFAALANGEDPIKALSQALKRLIVDLIKAVAQAAILALILSAIGGPGASKGFGSIFKGLLGFGGARANGGPVGAGRGFLVGENGPELFVPNTQGNIVPNMALAGAGGGGNVSFEIRGDVLLGIMKRTQSNRQATFG